MSDAVKEGAVFVYRVRFNHSAQVYYLTVSAPTQDQAILNATLRRIHKSKSHQASKVAHLTKIKPLSQYTLADVTISERLVFDSSAQALKHISRSCSMIYQSIGTHGFLNNVGAFI